MENQEKIVKEILDSPLIDPRFNLSIRALNCLKAADVETVRDLVSFKKNDLLKLRNFGRLSITELEELVSALNLTFGMKFESDESGKEIVIKVIKEPGFENLKITDKYNFVGGDVVNSDLVEILAHCMQDVSDILPLFNGETNKKEVLEKLALQGNKTALKILLKKTSEPVKGVDSLVEEFLENARNHRTLSYKNAPFHVKYEDFQIMTDGKPMVKLSCEIFLRKYFYEEGPNAFNRGNSRYYMREITELGFQSPLRKHLVEKEMKDWLLEQGYEFNLANTVRPRLKITKVVNRTSARIFAAQYQIEIRKIVK